MGGACFQKILVLDFGFWIGFDIWLRLGKNAMKRGWEEGGPALLGMKRWDPGSVGPKLSYVDFGLFGKVSSQAV